MSDFLAALGLAIVIEGLIYAAFPDQMKKWLVLFNALPVMRIRAFALGGAALGLVLLFVVRS
jgi:uncharacterized protein YjeT (DUF2065 family)